MSLTSDLTTIVKKPLEDWEVHREQIKDLGIDWLNLDAPSGAAPTGASGNGGGNPQDVKGPYAVANDAVARIATVHRIIRMAREAANSKVYAWVSPRLAAVAFEAVFDSCLAVWLAAGSPVSPDGGITPAPKLRPGVDRFIDWQVRLFAAAIEGR